MDCAPGSGQKMSVKDNTDKAVSLLREAANLLSGGRESEGNQHYGFFNGRKISNFD